MKRTRMRTRRLKTTVSVYSPSRCSRPDYCARRNRWSGIRVFGSSDGDQREFGLETRVTTNGNNKTPRCFTVVH